MLTLDEAKRDLRAGAVVAIPTDTVYGLAAGIGHPDAIDRLFELKGRPQDRAVAVLVSGRTQAAQLARIDAATDLLIDAFWPGPLTIVVPAAEQAPRAVVAEAGTIGLRSAAHPVVAEITDAIGPIAATSANLHGSPPVTDAAGVAELFPGVPVLDGGPCGSVASTVVRVAAGDGGHVAILRSGAVDAGRLERVVGNIER